MKWLVGLLVLANLAVGGYYVWVRGDGSSVVGQYVPLNADKITLQSVQLALERSPKPESPAQTLPSQQICVEWRGLLEADLERGREAVKTLATQRVLSVEELPVSRMYWVIFPPLPSGAAAQVKLRELAALKISDGVLIQEGAWKNGISLGLFALEETARRRLREVEALGVSGLRLESKPKPGTAYYYLIKSEDVATLKDLDSIRLAFPVTRLTRVACKR
jgi:hypothetical protein